MYNDYYSVTAENKVGKKCNLSDYRKNIELMYGKV